MKTIIRSSPSLRSHFGGLPSAALKAMVAGLLKADEAKNCQVAMRTYGEVDDKGTCFGCAATWTVQSALGRPMTPEEVDANQYVRFADQRWRNSDIVAFEDAIDLARCGDLAGLFRYMRKSAKHDWSFDERFALSTGDWKSQLPAVRRLIKELIKLGL